MDSLRVSASDLDAYRRFRDNDDAELSDLLAQLRRESAPTAAMMAGTALHTALENSEHGSFDQLSADGYVFDIQAEEEIDLPPLREMKITRDFVVAGTLVTLVGKVDAIRGRRVDDHKFTGNYDAERFLSSMQWRVYLMLFEAEEFRWNVFVGRETGDKHYVISAIHQLRAYAYPGMREDVLRDVAAFVDLARVHLPEKFIREAA